MLKDILEEKGISVYKLSKDTGIAYSTLNDIVIERTNIQNTSAATLYRLAKYLELSMENLYEEADNRQITINLFNEDRNVILIFGGNRVQYLGPKNLLYFHRINKIEDNVIYIDCYFTAADGTIYSEEDYIDLNDVLGEYNNILDSQYNVVLRKPGEKAKEEYRRNQ